MSADDIHQAITQADLRRGYQRLRASGLDLQIVQNHLAEWADRGVADCHLRVEGFTDFGKDHSFEESRTRPYKINDNDQDDQYAKNPNDCPEPAAALAWRGRTNGCISHKKNSSVFPV